MSRENGDIERPREFGLTRRQFVGLSFSLLMMGGGIVDGSILTDSIDTEVNWRFPLPAQSFEESAQKVSLVDKLNRKNLAQHIVNTFLAVGGSIGIGFSLSSK